MNTSRTTQAKGFILPSVLLIGLGVLAIGLSLLQVSSSIRTSIQNQYYNKLALEAAEAGAVYAKYCLETNNYNQTWGSSYGRPDLTQSTDCNGAPVSFSSLTANSVSSKFVASDLSYSTADGTYMVSASGNAARTIAGASVTSTQTSYRAVSPPALTYGMVAFGYYPNVPQTGSAGTFFAVRGSDGKFRVVGANHVGQLGQGSSANAFYLTPQIYPIPSGETGIQAFSNFTSLGQTLFIVTDTGNVYGSGQNYNGQLGNNANFVQAVKSPVKFIFPTGERADPASPNTVTPNGNTTYVFTQTHKVLAVGKCQEGQLGTGVACPGGIDSIYTASRVLLPDPTQVTNYPVQISTDLTSSFIRLAGGSVYGWGSNRWGQLAKAGGASEFIPIKIGSFGDSGMAKAVDIATDGDSLFVADDQGNAWGVGRNVHGELGKPSSTSQYTTLQQIAIPASAGKVVDVSTDAYTAIFRTDKGEVWGQGLNTSGELGVGFACPNAACNGQNVETPTKMILPSGVKAYEIYNTGLDDLGPSDPYYCKSYCNNTYVIGSDGKVYSTGSNQYSQIGVNDSTTPFYSTPQAMFNIDGTTITAQHVFAGRGTAVVTASDGSYYTVGNNDFGQLGLGDQTNRSTLQKSPYLKPPSGYIF